MRPVTKVIMVLAVVVLAVGVIWFASHQWGGGTHTSVPPVVAKKTDAEKPPYSDPLATYERWRQQLTGREPSHDTTTPAPAHRRNDIHSSSEHEGTVVARRSDEAVAGADPPGPVIRPRTIDGEVVTHGWKPAEGASNIYTIAAGDTFYDIAMKQYGDARFAAAIESANPGVNAKALKVGEHITLPDKSALAKPDEKAAPAPAPAAKVYVVQKGDTLIGISRRIYGDATMYRKIYDANTDILSTPNSALRVGQKLRLPEPK